MADVMTPEQRSRCMSRIRASDTEPELALRRAVWRVGLRYRLRSTLPGKPDLVFTRKKLAVFVDGCFWHACPAHATQPKANAKFWRAKIARNVERDREVDALLHERGWVVIRFWEHDIVAQVEKVVTTIKTTLSRIAL